MFEQNLTLFNQNFLDSISFEENRKALEALRAKDQGIHSGLEIQNKKASLKKTRTLGSEPQDDQEKNVITPSTRKSTPNSVKSFDNNSFSPEKSLLGKRKKLFPLVEGCNDVENYTLLNYIHEGVYGMVYRAKDNFSDQIYAIKKIKFEHEKEGFPVSSLREITLLQSLKHPNLVNMKEVVMGKSMNEVYMVMEYAENELRDLIQRHKYNFSIAEIKGLMKQLLQAMAYLHSKEVVHRDLKTSNILYTQKGLLKVCDFGLSRKMMSKKKSYTPIVVTLTYRAPELLLGNSNYSSKIDMWSVGCILAELLQKKSLFKSKTEMEQLDLIFKTLGTPCTALWPGWKQLKYSKFFEGKTYPPNQLSEILTRIQLPEGESFSKNGFDLLEQLLTYNPELRISATEALKHPWFSESPLPKEPHEMPKIADTNEAPRDQTKKMCLNPKVVA